MTKSSIRCLAVATLLGLGNTPATALDALPQDEQRALEFGAAASAAARIFGGSMIEGITFVRQGVYRVWSERCTVEVAVSYAFDEQNPLSPPKIETEPRHLKCEGPAPL